MTTRRLFDRDLSTITTDAFGRMVERLLLHLGFTDVSNVDGSGDGGADLVARYGTERWVIQCKWKASSSVDSAAVDEAIAGAQLYGASRAAVVTTTTFTKKARERQAAIKQATGLEVGLWSFDELSALEADPACRLRFSEPKLRQYQVDAFQAARHDIERHSRSLVIMATGLGKTVVAGTIIDWYLEAHPTAKVLVLAHTRDLVDQLERALWALVPRTVPTQQLQGDEKPEILNGVTVATIQSAIAYIRSGFRPDFIFVDEAHHVGEVGQFAEALSLCTHAAVLGATATPWRGDKFDLVDAFGEPSYRLGIEEGMRLGYLVDVDYRLFVDNINWDQVRSESAHQYSIKELNQRLFLPQRDEQIRDELLAVWNQTVSPRGIVFCQTIEHAERMREVLGRVPQWRTVATIHNGIPKNEQKQRLAKFRLGDISLLVSVDILNEGVDVPDVNVICFARVTHSRRIFVQQLGRGLRLRPGKTHTTVLDFVSDVRRVAAALHLRKSVVGETEEVLLSSRHSIRFSDVTAESFLGEWIKDAASLETAADEVRLNFPSF